MSVAVLPAAVQPTAPSVATRRGDAIRWIAGLHDELTSFFGRLDRGGTFAEDRWERPGGGGGVARVMTDGVTFEKAGINRSAVMGELPELAARRLGGQGAAAGATHFFATGVSLVVHPRSPKVPTVHLNVRYFELTDEHGHLTDCWFGGGTDLTPFYPHVEDGVTFHRALRDMANRHHARFYPDFKHWCDEYFVLKHRAEQRGVGGVFFDDFSELGFERSLAMMQALGDGLLPAYLPIVQRRKDSPYGERERAFQLYRRGRYVEFNLVWDRGTHFGLQSGGRTESILLSMPPLASWSYQHKPQDGSPEARLYSHFLVRRDWLEHSGAD